MILEYWEICNPKSSIQNGRNALVKYLGAVAGGSALLHRGLNERELVQVEKFFPQEHLAHERERSHDFSKILEKIRSWVFCICGFCIPYQMAGIFLFNFSISIL